MIGVLIGEKHSYNDWGLILTSKVISPPAPKLNLVSIPLRDGSLDLTETLTDDIKYEDRTIFINFAMAGPRKRWNTKISEIKNYLHGKRLKLIFDDDKSFYYIGRISVNEWTSDKSVGNITLECIAEPYKYDVLSSSDDWLWDTFDFENGYIANASDVVVDGSVTVTILGRKKKVAPTITVSENMVLNFNGETYNLTKGINKIYTLFLSEGENELIFTGNGTVTVDYRGGSL